MKYTYDRMRKLFDEMLSYICECSPSEADCYITLTEGIGFTDEELGYEGFDVEEMKEEVKSNLTYKAYIIISNEIHEEATFYTYEEAKEWCDMAHTEIEEYEYDDGIQYIAYILIGEDVHDSAEFDTKEEAEKWCDAMTTEIKEVFEE